MKLIYAALVLAVSIPGAEKKVKLESLPPAVQAAIREQTKGSAIAGISTEVENGKTTYEVETKVNGKSRNLELDQTGKVLEIEDEVDLESIPAPAKAALQKRAAGGTIAKVEKLTAGSSISYEATVRTKAGKNTEVAVNADGTLHKED